MLVQVAEAPSCSDRFISLARRPSRKLLGGFQFDALRLRPIAVLLAVAVAAMLLARAAVGFGLLHRQRGAERLPLNWGAAIALGGLRGALSIVLALALPDTLPARDLLVSMTVGMVLLSIIVQGLSMPVLMRMLRLREDG
ncbi:MAG: cation:proton antiporter [bacterium]